MGKKGEILRSILMAILTYGQVLLFIAGLNLMLSITIPFTFNTLLGAFMIITVFEISIASIIFTIIKYIIKEIT